MIWTIRTLPQWTGPTPLQRPVSDPRLPDLDFHKHYNAFQPLSLPPTQLWTGSGGPLASDRPKSAPARWDGQIHSPTCPLNDSAFHHNSREPDKHYAWPKLATYTYTPPANGFPALLVQSAGSSRYSPRRSRYPVSFPGAYKQRPGRFAASSGPSRMSRSPRDPVARSPSR
jgi:hypothetical protein